MNHEQIIRLQIAEMVIQLALANARIVELEARLKAKESEATG